MEAVLIFNSIFGDADFANSTLGIILYNVVSKGLIVCIFIIAAMVFFSKFDFLRKK